MVSLGLIDPHSLTHFLLRYQHKIYRVSSLVSNKVEEVGVGGGGGGGWRECNKSEGGRGEKDNGDNNEDYYEDEDQDGDDV